MKSAESCYHVIARGVGDMFAFTVRGRNCETDSMMQDSANPSLHGSLERGPREVELL